MSPAKHLLTLMIAVASVPLGSGCLALSFGGKHVNATREEESPLAEQRLLNLEARIWNLEQAVAPHGPPVEQVSP